MLDPSLYVHNIPGLDEALPLDVYAELTNHDPETLVEWIRSRDLLGTLHKGSWYVEAPPFGEDKLRKILTQRKGASGQSTKTYQQNDASQESRRERSRPEMENSSPDVRFAQVLGLSGKVTREDVKKRWRELTMQYHPDKVSHLGPKLREVAEQEMKAINEAYGFFRQKYGI